MIPAGPERDKRIAELRGEFPKCAGKLDTVILNCQEPPMECASEGCPHQEYKPYSTDITYAIKLWPEMRDAGYIVMSSHRKGNALCHLTISPLVFYKCETKTEADAISGCWLKWMEAQ